MLLSDPVLQEFGRRPVAERRVLPFSVAKNLDVFKGGRLNLCVRGVASAALADTVLTTLPFAFAKDLQPGRIDPDRHRSAPGPPGNLHRQDTGTTGPARSGTGRSR